MGMGFGIEKYAYIKEWKKQTNNGRNRNQESIRTLREKLKLRLLGIIRSRHYQISGNELKK